MLLLATTLLVASPYAPFAMTLAIYGLAIFVFFANLCLKIAAIFAGLAHARAEAARDPTPTTPLHPPMVSILVPLYREDKIVPHLIARMKELDYPAECLDVLLCVEADDTKTRAALGRLRLPQ